MPSGRTSANAAIAPAPPQAMMASEREQDRDEDRFTFDALALVRFGRKYNDRITLRTAPMPASTAFAAFMLALVCRSRRSHGATAQVAKTLRVAFPIAENGLRPAGDLRRVLGEGLQRDLRSAVHVRLLRAAREARPEHRRRPAADHATADARSPSRSSPASTSPRTPRSAASKRELTAHDYVYSIKRILDPKVRSYYLYVFENRLVGLDPVLAQARKTGKFDYDAPIEGLKALDKYTLQIRMKDPDFAIPHWLATTASAAVAKEVVAAKGDASGRVMEDPVGTGPYKLAEWRRSQRIVLEANPDFRDVRYPAPPAGSSAGGRRDREGACRAASCRSCRASRSRSSRNRSRDCSRSAAASSTTSTCPRRSPKTVLDGDKLKPDLAKAGVRLHRQVEPSLAFFFFNMDDPVVGGYTPEKVALRRAIVMAQDRKERSRDPQRTDRPSSRRR